jgi:hypothetical protein
MKMRNMKRILFFMTRLLLNVFIVNAQNAKPLNVVTTAVPFLNISTDARAGGMGDAGIATSADVNSVFWNIGKLAFAETKGGVGVNYTPWLREMVNDMYHISLNSFYKIGEEQAVYAGLRYFSLGDMQFEDYNGNHLQAFHPREWCVNGGYSRKLSSRSGLGIGLKFIYSNLADKGVEGNVYKAGTAFAGDVGYYYKGTNEMGTGWSFGATLSNLGSKIDYSNDASQKNFIPANLGIGAAYSKAINEQNKIAFAADINKLLVPTPPQAGDSAALFEYRNKGVVGSWFSSLGDAPGGFKEELKEFQFSLGTEYWYDNQFAVRAGYFYENPAKGNRSYFSVGASVKYTLITANFSYAASSGNSTNKNPLANTIRFGLQFDFSN